MEITRDQIEEIIKGVTQKPRPSTELNNRTTVPLGVLWSAVVLLLGGIGSVLLMFLQINASMDERFVSAEVFRAEMQSLRTEMSLRHELLLNRLADLSAAAEGVKSAPESRR